jgi:type I restriction enzyme S subunit
MLIEALIDGKVTETDLVAAQEALERGDNSADRALLRRLTRQGIDAPDQPPLFPDLDALYTLLAESGGHDAGTP